MSNSFFQFKQFLVHQDRCAMKVTTDGCLFGAWAAEESQIPIAIRTKVKSKNVLDVGAGTGLLSLMLAQKNLSCSIDAIELDKEAFEQAKENIVASPFVERIQIMHGDARTFSFTKKYDLIISNPPFYEKEITSSDKKKNIAHHHSGLSLDELLDIINSNLSPQGSFYLMLPFKRNKEVQKMLLRQNLSVSKIVFVKQSTKHDYFRVMIEGKLHAESIPETFIDEISVWDDDQQYTPDFKALLKDYYLKV
jgi:tRNA1Val (adenine37-N6)-methyltransferase